MDAPVDFELESSAGGTRRLSSLRGRVVAIFWEDRDRQRANFDLKLALARMASAERGLTVLAVGDVKAYDSAPARGIVRGALATLARVIGVEILFDWTGALAEAPFSLRPGEPNLLVLDAEGRPLLRMHGDLDADDQGRVLDTVRAHLRDAARVAA